MREYMGEYLVKYTGEYLVKYTGQYLVQVKYLVKYTGEYTVLVKYPSLQGKTLFKAICLVQELSNPHKIHGYTREIT